MVAIPPRRLPSSPERVHAGRENGTGLPVLRQNPVRQRGASSSARRPGSTGKEDSARPESVAPCQLRSLRETLTRPGERRATAYPPRGAIATGCLLSDCNHWGVGAPGGTRTPGIRLRSPSALPVFSTGCRTEGRSRVRMASRGQPHRKRPSPPVRGRVPESRRGCIIGRNRQPPRGRRLRAVVPSSQPTTPADSPLRQCGLGDAPCVTSPGTPWITLGTSRTAQSPRRECEKAGSPREFGATETIRVPEAHVLAGSNREGALDCGRPYRSSGSSWSCRRPAGFSPAIR